MQNADVTVIITAYNVEKTIARAIESCINQTYKIFEILVINDCSTDSTSKILEEYSQYIKVINNETNLGAGMSRRIGTKKALGKYTMFLDGDDYLNNDCIEHLYIKALEYDADMVASGMRYVDQDGKVIKEFHVIKEYTETGMQVYKSKTDLCKRWLNNKLIRRTLWDNVDYSSRRYIEDTQTCLELFFNCKLIVNIPYTGLNYVQNPESLCHTSSMLKTTIYRVLCAKDVCNIIKKYAPEDYMTALKVFVLRVNELGTYDIYHTQYSEELAEIFTFLIKNTTL